MFDNTESGLTTDEGYRAEDFNEVYESSPVEVEQDAPAQQSRWRSWAAWVSIVSLISIIFSAWNIWPYIGITSEWFDKIAAAVGAVLVAFGVFNNPTKREGF